MADIIMRMDIKDALIYSVVINYLAKMLITNLINDEKVKPVTIKRLYFLIKFVLAVSLNIVFAHRPPDFQIIVVTTIISFMISCGFDYSQLTEILKGNILENAEKEKSKERGD